MIYFCKDIGVNCGSNVYVDRRYVSSVNFHALTMQMKTELLQSKCSDIRDCREKSNVYTSIANQSQSMTI